MTCFLLLAILSFQDQPHIKENLQVEYRQIQIRAQDKDGMPLENLKAADFRIKVNGTVLVPESFQEIDLRHDPADVTLSDTVAVSQQTKEAVVEEEIAEPTVSRHVSVLVDSNIASFAGFQHLKQATGTMLDSLRPSDRVNVYDLQSSPRLVTDFVSPGEARERLDGLIYQPTLWNYLRDAQQVIGNTVAQHMTEKLGPQRTQALEARAGRAVGRNRGRVDPGKDASLAYKLSGLSFINESVKRKRRVKDMHANRVSSAIMALGNGLKHHTGDRSVYVFTSGGFSDSANIMSLKQITQRLNWENITVHTFHLRDRDNASLNLTDKRNYTVTDLRDFEQRLKDNEYIQQGNGNNNLYEDERELKTQPRNYALETGGTFVSAFNPLQIESQVARLSQSSSHYYLLSYVPQKRVDTVSVALAEPKDGASVFVGRRRGNADRYNQLSKKERRMDFANTLIYGYERNETSVRWELQTYAKDGSYRFPVLGKLDGAFPEGGYEVGIVALDKSSQVIDERKAEITRGNDAGALEFYDLLVTNERPATIRAMIREKVSGKTSVISFDPLDLPANQPNLSSIALIPPGQRSVYAIHAIQEDKIKKDGQKVARSSMDPLALQAGQVVSVGMGPFKPGQPIGLFFKAHYLNGSPNNYTFESFLRLGTEKVALPFNIVKVLKAGSDLNIMGTLHTKGLSPGTYEMGVRLVHKGTGDTSEYRTREFTIGNEAMY